MKILIVLLVFFALTNDTYSANKPKSHAQKIIYINKPVNWKGEIDRRMDPRLPKAAIIAKKNAEKLSKSRCWEYVKKALLASDVVKSYPKTDYAAEAGRELVANYGFYKLAIMDPYAAPIGSVIVYVNNRNKEGHVEIRTRDGFVSDFRAIFAISSLFPKNYKVSGIYAKGK